MGIERQLPVAEQVATLLYGRIAEGAYVPGERLPSESNLADELGVSRGTVRSALAVLATAGLIIRRQGDGTYVRDVNNAGNSLMHVVWEFTRFIELSGRVPTIRVVSLDKRPVTEEEASALNIGLDETVISAVRIIYADGQPVIYSTNIHPATLFTEELDQLDATIEMRRFLRRYCNREIACGDMDVSAAMAHDQIREALSLELNSPILLVEATFYDAEGCPLVHAISYYGDEKLSLHDVRRMYPWSRIG